MGYAGLADNLYRSISGYELKTKLCDSSVSCSLGSITLFYITIGYDNYEMRFLSELNISSFNTSNVTNVTYV